MIRIRRQLWSSLWHIALSSARTRLASSVWLWVNVLSQLISLVVLIAFWRAVFAEQAEIAGLHQDTILTYLIAAQLVAGATPQVISRLATLIESGNIALELLRPVDLQVRLFVHNVAGAMVALLQRVPVAILACVILGLDVTSSAAVWLGFLLAITLSLPLQFIIQWLASSLIFVTHKWWGIMLFVNALFAFWGGAIVPIPLMPGWLQQIANALPFRAVIATPAAILSGMATTGEIAGQLLLQLGWLVGLFFASRALMRIAARRLDVYGG